MIHLILFLAMGVGLQSSVPTSTGIQQIDTHGPCVGDGCVHDYQYITTHGVKPKRPKHDVKDTQDPYIDDAGCLHDRNDISCYMPDSPWAKASCWSIDGGYICPSIPWYTTKDRAEKDELPDPTKLDMCMMDHGPYGCEEFGGPIREGGYGYKNCVMSNGSVWIQKDCGVNPIASMVSNGAITVEGGDGYTYCPNKERNGIVLCSSPDAGKIVPGGDPRLTVPPCAAAPGDSFPLCSLPSGPNVAIGSCESGLCTLGSPDNTSSSIVSNDGSKVISLSNKEYNHLQEIRQAVGDEEKRLAAKYGADLDDYVLRTFPSLSIYPEAIHNSDHFEFHGRFLIISKTQ